MHEVLLYGMCSASNRVNIDLDTSATSLVSSTNYAYSSFPVDVIVYIRVQPSLVRFTCLPVSRVECLLRMPSLDVVFSTKKADSETGLTSDAVTGSKTKGAFLFTDIELMQRGFKYTVELYYYRLCYDACSVIEHCNVHSCFRCF